VGSVIITNWYYENLDSKLSLVSASPEFEPSEEEMERLRQTQKQYNKQYRKYKRSQKDIEDEKKTIPIELSSTKNLKDALSSLENKVCKLGNKFYRINKAKIESKKTITLYSDLQKTNMSTEKEKEVSSSHHIQLFI
jgi:DNA repair ATPase RecN